MDTTSFPLQLLEHLHGTVAVVGSMNVDYTITTARLPEPGETVNGGPLVLLPGGKSGNQAAAAALLGADVRMFGAVGSDSNADFLLGHLAAAGVDTSHVRHVDGPSGLTVITVDDTAENTIVYSAGSNAQVSVDYVESKIGELTGADVLGLCLESPIETVTACARMCHEAGVRVLLNDSPFTADLPAELIEHTDILLVNEIEMAQLLDLQAPADDDWSAFDWPLVLERLEAIGIRQAVVTLGADGSVVLDATADGDLLALVQRERVKELCFEGHNFFDITRWKQNLVREHNTNSTVRSLAYPNDLFVLPIPQYELDANENMKPNPTVNK